MRSIPIWKNVPHREHKFHDPTQLIYQEGSYSHAIGVCRGRAMNSTVVKRSVVVAGHKTSVSLEDEFWKGLREIADGRDTTLTELVSTIDTDRRQGNLSSAIRLFVLGFYRDQIGSLRDKSSGHRGKASAQLGA